MVFSSECDACYSLLIDDVAQLRSDRDALAANVSSIEARHAAFGNIAPFVERFKLVNDNTARLVNFVSRLIKVVIAIKIIIGLQLIRDMCYINMIIVNKIKVTLYKSK